jgi:hypothetical protein
MEDCAIHELDAEARLAWQKLRTGAGDYSDWDSLADVSNVCSIRAPRIGNGERLISICKKAAESLQAMQDRADKTGKWGACHLSIAAVPELLEFYAELVKNSTPRQMMDAHYEAGALKETI